MRARPSVLAAAILLALPACGARTRLDERHASAGGGGAATTTTSSSGTFVTSTTAGPATGTGGSGGGPLCAPQFADVFGDVNDSQRPALTTLGAIDPLDGSVVLSFALGDTALPAVPKLVSIAIDPWSAWPPNTSTVYEMLPDAGASFAVARGTSAELAFAGERVPSPGVLYAETAVDEPSPIADTVTTSTRQIRFLASNGLGLLGAEAAGNATSFLDAWIVKPTPEGPFFQGPIAIGCAMSRIAADAIGLPDTADVDGFLVAFGRGGTPGSGPSCDAGGAATALQIARVTSAGEVTMGALIGAPFPPITEEFGIPRVRVAPRLGGGAWVLWFGATIDGEDAPPPALLLTQVLPDLSDGGTTTIADTGWKGGFALTPVGGGLLLAWVASAGDTQHLFVRLVDGSFGTVSEQSFPMDGVVDPELSLVASPNEDAALVAWSSRIGDMKTPHRVRLAKVCLPTL